MDSDKDNGRSQVAGRGSLSSFRRILILAALCFLTVTAFQIRFKNFVYSPAQSVDEMVYYSLGRQLAHNALDYNTLAITRELTRGGRILPEYFYEPLFKHPPGFPLLIMFALKLFGGGYLTAGLVPAFLGALMIPLIYWLGVIFFDRRTAMTAALLLWMDPISIICSQKVWMDIPIAFWTLLAAVFFAAGIKREHRAGNTGWFFILSGVSAGLATNTKYTGIFITLAIALYALLYHRGLFRSKCFRVSLVLPFVMLVPWAVWNLDIYGKGFFVQQVAMHVGLITLFRHLGGYDTLFLALPVAVAAAVVLWAFLRRRRRTGTPARETSERDERLVRYFSWLILCVVFFVILHRQLGNAFRPFYLPAASWHMGFFSGRPLAFYFGRLLEFSPFYIFAVADLFLYRPQEDRGHAFLRITAWVILLFFVAWGNFQSRYILSALPFLLLLSAAMMDKIHERILSSPLFSVRLAGRLVFLSFVMYAVLKTMHVNIALSFPNNLCYF